MPEKQTLPFEERNSMLPVDTLYVEVIEGENQGASIDGDTVTIGTANGNDLVLEDPTVSRYHVELKRMIDGTVRIIDHGSTNGTMVGDVRIDAGSVSDGAILRIGRTSVRIGEGTPKHVELHRGDQLAGLRGASDQMRRLMRQVEKAARTEASLLIVGESGTGKELIARALHDLGPRADKPFVTVDCGSMSPNLVASELFGHERGAFTSADRQHVGAFERANGGTIFLDEIGELPPELQPNLLGALERRRFRRVGGRSDIEVDVRVVAATNRDLRAEVNDGRFRLDLYYRIAVVTLQVAPLRERPDDVDLLIEHFLRDCGYEEEMHELFDTEVLRRLRAHHWPGNVRELRNVVEATVAMGEAPMELVGEGIQTDGSLNSDDAIDFRRVLPLPYKQARAGVLEEFERRYLGHWLERAGGNVAKAAREAKMDRSHLFHLLRRHGLR